MASATDTQEVRARAKWVRTSPRKARLVAEHIRGRSVPEARTVLAFTPRAAAREVEKVLRSAVANAEASHGLIGDDLYVSAAYVDEGPMLKRWRARARGRVARIRKRTCHITILLAPSAPRAVEESEARPKRRRRAAAPKEAAATKAQAPKAPEAEKPKRTRAPRKKTTETAEAETTEATETTETTETTEEAAE
jgi:large subunit ribosomal protein L22